MKKYSQECCHAQAAASQGCESASHAAVAPAQVKSMQMFHKPVQRAAAGDRLGVCVTQLDAKLLERGLACAPGEGCKGRGGGQGFLWACAMLASACQAVAFSLPLVRTATGRAMGWRYGAMHMGVCVHALAGGRPAPPPSCGLARAPGEG